MIDIEHEGCYPLNKEHVEANAPPAPGVYILSIRLVSGNHKIFFAARSNDLRRSLRRMSRKNFSSVPEMVKEYASRYMCYFTFLETRAGETGGRETGPLISDPELRNFLIGVN